MSRCSREPWSSCLAPRGSAAAGPESRRCRMVERRTLLARNLLAALLFTGTSALAQPTFPKFVQDTLHVPCDISQRCTLCHNTNAGGRNNLRNPGFGQSMKNSCDFNGLVPETLG